MPDTRETDGDAGELVITIADPLSPEVVALLERHLAFAHLQSPACHVHALEPEKLRDPAVTFYGARRDGRLVGVGALRQLEPGHAELKSMHTLEEERGRGVGSAILAHLLSVAAEQNLRRVSLETGTQEGFAPARRMYARAGFRTCAPFADYTENPFSTCMTLEL